MKRFLFGLLLIVAPPSVAELRQPEAVELLRAAREAALAVESASFRFENGDAAAPFGWVTGTVTTVRGPSDDAGSIRVDGRFHAQPAFNRPGFEFRFARDGRRAGEWRSDQDEIVEVSIAADPVKAQSLEGNASYGFLPELFKSSPYWMELELATRLELAGSREIGGVLCDVVRATMDSANGPVHQDWYLAREDRLPRGLLWWMEAGGQRAEMPFHMFDLEIDRRIENSTFRLDRPQGAQVVQTDEQGVAPGQVAPDWSLEDADGTKVRLADLRGRVVVMDFWNTGCYLCHNALPAINALADEMREEEVSFLALGIWERGDARAYWRDRGFSPRLLPEADDIAAAYGITGQPAIVVVGPDGRVLLAQVGFTADRQQKVRQAIRRGLEATKASAASG